jgi:hypothetical protein
MNTRPDLTQDPENEQELEFDNDDDNNPGHYQGHLDQLLSNCPYMSKPTKSHFTPVQYTLLLLVCTEYKTNIITEKPFPTPEEELELAGCAWGKMCQDGNVMFPMPEFGIQFVSILQEAI